MICLDLYSPGEPARKHLFVNAPAWIGTSLECQIPLAGTGVEDRHACIHLEGGQYRLRAAATGTRVVVNERVADDHVLAEGDNVLIGKHVLRVRWMLDGPRFDATDEWEKCFLVINVPGQPPEHFALGLRTAKVGRAASCDLVLPVPQLLPHHATISWQDEGLVIEKGEGPGLIKVNGEFTRFRALSHGDEIQLGPVQMTFVSRRRVFKTMEFLSYDPYGPEPGSRDTRHDDSAPPPVDEEEEAPPQTFESKLPSPRNPLRFLDENWEAEAAAPVASPPDRHPAPQPPPPSAPPVAVRPVPSTPLFLPETDAPRVPRVPFLGEVLRHDKGVLKLAGFERYKVYVSRLAQTFSASGARGRVPHRGVMILGPRGAGRKHALRALAYLLGLRIVRFQWEKMITLPPESWPEVILEFLDHLADRGNAMALFGDIDNQMRTLNNMAREKELVRNAARALVEGFQARFPKVVAGISATRYEWVPPQVMQKGNVVDEIFMVDYPGTPIRAALVDAYLGGRPGEFSDTDPRRMVRIMQGLSGGEIRRLIHEARPTASGRWDWKRLEGRAQILLSSSGTRKAWIKSVEHVKTLARPV